MDRAKLGLKTSLEDQILQISTVSDLRDAAKASRISQRQTWTQAIGTEFWYYQMKVFWSLKLQKMSKMPTPLYSDYVQKL